ncbi:hypothetical protein [Bradyrhizobium sp.]|uniref:hypothetical protein n=1 Tax=Bradyrhizobium sp. TaxID=376 RepID=UPI001DA1C7F5|nr:hypothetical protein [Bradyrhizobium sp.]MBI5319204.1 hypothetical protein [Bradyrhizobium sp.]
MKQLFPEHVLRRHRAALLDKRTITETATLTQIKLAASEKAGRRSDKMASNGRQMSSSAAADMLTTEIKKLPSNSSFFVGAPLASLRFFCGFEANGAR